jgi:hypothetical protein
LCTIRATSRKAHARASSWCSLLITLRPEASVCLQVHAGVVMGKKIKINDEDEQ